MTELEQQLMAGMKELSEQYRREMLLLQEQNTALSGRVQTLAHQVNTLAKALSSLNGQLMRLSKG